MIMKVFAVFDTKIGTYGQPFFMSTVPSAKRAFQGACNDPSTMLHKHPADFALFLLGEFDDESGALSTLPPENLGLASNFVQEA